MSRFHPVIEYPPTSFLGLTPPENAYSSARFAVLPIPYDGSATFLRGTRMGPAAILFASPHIEEFDEELLADFSKVGIATLDPIDVRLDHAEETQASIFSAARQVVADGKFLFGLGGDHSVSAPLVRAVHEKHKDLSLLQLDAHTDLRQEFYGSRHSHACVMRHVVEMGVPVAPVGIRSMGEEDYRFLSSHSIDFVTAKDCRENNRWIDRVLSTLSDTVYITIDIDVFDPAYAPGTGTPEPGGLDWFQVLPLLRRVAEEKTIVAADIVEVMPIAGQAVTELLAARLAYKLMAYVSSARQWA